MNHFMDHFKLFNKIELNSKLCLYSIDGFNAEFIQILNRMKLNQKMNHI